MGDSFGKVKKTVQKLDFNDDGAIDKADFKTTKGKVFIGAVILVVALLLYIVA